MSEILPILNEIRCTCGVLMKLGESAEWIKNNQAHTPFISFVSPPQIYETPAGKIMNIS